jgi:hypothetical protein
MPAARVSVQIIGRRFVDAYNRRHVDDLIALSDPAIEFHPTSLVGARRRYDGHDGLRRWVKELDTLGIEHQVRVLEVRALEKDGLLVLSEVLLDGKLISPGAMFARLGENGRIVEARAFLTDEEMLKRVGWVHDRPADDA